MENTEKAVDEVLTAPATTASASEAAETAPEVTITSEVVQAPVLTELAQTPVVTTSVLANALVLKTQQVLTDAMDVAQAAVAAESNDYAPFGDADVAKVSAVVPEELPPSKAYKILTEPGRGTQLFLESGGLREFMYLYTVADMIIPASCIPQAGDSVLNGRMRSKYATFPVSSFFPYLETLRQVDPDDYQYQGFEASDYRRMLDDIDKLYQVVLEEERHDLENGLYSFSTLHQHLSLTRPFIILGEGKAKMCLKINSVKIQSSFFMGVYIAASMEIYVDSGDGKLIKKTVDEPILYQFGGKKTIADLGLKLVYNLDEVPAEYSSDINDLIVRGEKAIKYSSKATYLKSSGSLVRKGHRSERVYKAKGRIMIDRTNMEKADPNYDKYFPGYNRYNNESEEGVPFAEATKEIKLSMSPFLYGYSFVSKVWGELMVDDLSDIVFRADAYDKLVLDSDTKTLLRTLVATGKFETTDVIDGKGGGCIALLEGPPGLGKTLSAEVISEVLKKPLYMVSVGELGTDVDSLESALQDILSLCQEWDAVLLIDECDIFLEARTDLDIQRNAMVAVFLRLLEYYNGIMFLTTNRADNIDPAFFSRISVAISYPKLVKASRIKIWKNNLEMFKAKFSDAQIDKFASYVTNGRQIKNIARNAATLARAENRPVSAKDVQLLIDHTVKFSRKSFMKHVRHFFAKIFK